MKKPHQNKTKNKKQKEKKKKKPTTTTKLDLPFTTLNIPWAIAGSWYLGAIAPSWNPLEVSHSLLYQSCIPLYRSKGKSYQDTSIKNLKWGPQQRSASVMLSPTSQRWDLSLASTFSRALHTEQKIVIHNIFWDTYPQFFFQKFLISIWMHSMIYHEKD